MGASALLIKRAEVEAPSMRMATAALIRPAGQGGELGKLPRNRASPAVDPTEL
jgi:hypothetical protein